MDPAGGMTRVEMDCGHVSRRNQTMTYTAGRPTQCFDCGRRMRRVFESRRNELMAMSVGATTTMNGHAVTRWAEFRFEVGTWGRGRSMSASDAVRLTWS
jgi:hypothetical protein